MIKQKENYVNQGSIKMKKLSLIKYLLVLIFASVKFIYAVQNQLPTLYVLHINGINTTYTEARKNLKYLKEASQMTSTGK